MLAVDIFDEFNLGYAKTNQSPNWQLNATPTLLGTVYWELSMEEKFSKFCKSGSIRECFLALLSWSEFLYMRLSESQKFSRELWQRR